MHKSRDIRNSRPNSASRVTSTTGSTNASINQATRRLGNTQGSAENLKSLYDRGRNDNQSQPTKMKPVSIKPKQNTISMQRQKAAKRSPARNASINSTSVLPSKTGKTLVKREQLEKMEMMERKLYEFKLQNNAVEDLQIQLKQLKQTINAENKSSLSVENEQLRKQLNTLSQTMASMNCKEEPTTPDSISEYELKTNQKRLSIAEELDATQNELKEAEEKLSHAIQQNINMKNEREEIVKQLKEISPLPGTGSLIELLKSAIGDGSLRRDELQLKLNDIEEENEGLKRELAECKMQNKHMEEIEELQSKIVELESELECSHNKYCELLQMDQADREAFSNQIRNDLISSREKDEIMARMDLEVQELNNEHRKDLIELSMHIDEMRERDEKKDTEIEQMRLTLYDLEDAVLQQIAVKKYAEQQLQKQTDEMNKVYEELMQKDQELIRLRRLNQQNEDEREQLQRNVSLAMTVAKDAKESKQNEIDELRSKNHLLEEENMRHQIEISQLQRNRRSSPTLKDQPLSPGSNSSAACYKVTSGTDDWRFNRNRSQAGQDSSVQNVIDNFKSEDDKSDVNTSASTSGSTKERRKLSADQMKSRSENDKQARERVTQRVMELRKKASERPLDKTISRRTSTNSLTECSEPESQSQLSYYPSVISSDPLSKLSKKYGGSKRNSLLKWCQEQLKDYHEIDVTNFSTTWADGLALCGLLHSRLPLNVPYKSLVAEFNKRKNVETALKACQVLGISSNNLPSVDDFLISERPDWQRIMKLVTQIYIHFTQENN